ncbi:MAG TPA: hypothetical protein VFO94_08300, partial [Gammaproteobacteria bacterium]|nr:hypothetical protein [Gammaproteobacteria bacterium]
MEKALGAPIAGLAEAARQFAAANDQRIAERKAPGADAVAPDAENVDEAELKGYLMQNVNQPQPTEPEATEMPAADDQDAYDDASGAVWAALGILAVLLAWRWRHRRMRA